MRVVIIVQENHTTDNYFRGLAPWGANVVTGWPTVKNPPPQPPFSAYYPPHDRHAYFDWLTKGTAEHSQFDTAADLPFYLYLAITGAFFENHCAGFGTNSTPNHLLLVGGQSPTLGNPPRRSQPVWDLPSVPGLAQEHGIGWSCYVPPDLFPIGFYKQLQGSPNIRQSSDLAADAAAGKLPELVYLWHPGGLDEHPPADITAGMNQIWQSVDAVVRGGGWDETVFMLTWDDWGGFDDHVKTPAVEYTPDNVQLAYGPRVPLLMFGGKVKPGIDSRWCSHVSLPKTAMQLLGLPAMGVPRLDSDPGLADLIEAQMASNPQPPAFGTAIVFPAPPQQPPAVHPLPPAPASPVPVPSIVLRGGKTMPPPNDVPLPRQPNPPTSSRRRSLPSVLHRTGMSAIAAGTDPSTLIAPTNLAGKTEHFAVYVDPALSVSGQADAAGVLKSCEQDYAAVAGYFGGIAAGPFNVVLFANPGGAYHDTCAATDLFCDAKSSPPDADYSEFLNIAEFVEVFEAVQGAGWDCGASNGEGLSRVLATDAYPNQLDGFATAAVWLDSSRADFVDRNEASDTNSEANGCSVLFLNWLRFQLNLSWAQIVAAGAPTLGETYRKLTGNNDGKAQFEKLINQHFPKGRPSNLTTDNPFPL